MTLIEKLKADLEKAVQEENFERAAELRERIRDHEERGELLTGPDHSFERFQKAQQEMREAQAGLVNDFHGEMEKVLRDILPPLNNGVLPSWYDVATYMFFVQNIHTNIAQYYWKGQLIVEANFNQLPPVITIHPPSHTI